MKKIKEYGFIICFAITLLVPLYGKLLDGNITLSGVTQSPEEVEGNLKNWNNGLYQSYLNSVWENEFPGRKALLRVRNQMLYSILRISPNSNVVIGKDGYLYEPGYILCETQAYPPETEEYFNTLGNNLKELNRLLTKNGKELYVFVTPSKAHIFREKIPNRYMFLDNEEAYSYTNYSKLIEMLDENTINYYDSVSFIENNVELLRSPVFYASGIHWSHAWGNTCAAQFLDYINSCSKYDLGSVVVSESLSDEPVWPDTDLYSSLNIVSEPNEQWWSAEMTVHQKGNDKPNVFMRGNSFMGQSLDALIKSGLFGEDVYFENNIYYINQHEETYTLSGFTAYDELDLDYLVGKSDIVVLEVNEANISNMSNGLIEYLLEHPDYLDYSTKIPIKE